MGKKEVERKTKLQIYDSIYIPTLLYGSESWVVNKKVESRMNAAEMKALRKVYGVTKRDRIRNQTIRDELKMQSVIDRMEKKTLSWYGHVIRMSEERLPRKILETKSIGNRGKGRPRVKWEEYVEDLCSRKGTTITETKRKAKDRKEYSKWVAETRR